MAENFQFKLVTPTGVAFDQAVESVTAAGPLGEFGVLAAHINFITSLKPGVLTIKVGDNLYRHFVVSGGLAEVKDGVLTVLATEAQSSETLERTVAALEVDAAEERLKHMSFYELEYTDAEHALQLARARARAAELNHATRG